MNEESSKSGTPTIALSVSVLSKLSFGVTNWVSRSFPLPYAEIPFMATLGTSSREDEWVTPFLTDLGVLPRRDGTH